jgi:diguanylate cyclase (GGDEF)-like protein
MFDMTSLLLGAAISGIGLCLTMLTLVRGDEASRYKITWAIGAGLFVCHVFAYYAFAHGASLPVGALACAVQSVAALCLYVSVRQFTDKSFRPLATFLSIAVPYVLIVPTIFAAGYDGIALVMQNAVTGTLLLMGAVVYLRILHETPTVIAVISVLYALTGVSFLMCGLVIFLDGQWSIGYPPDNWAEKLNVVISVLAISGAGALTLSLDQARVARKNQLTAMSDPLTGLLNRRGLAFGQNDVFFTDTAIVLFDLDHFKQINDRHGHAVGDLVIRSFADILRLAGRSADRKARLGGEEFAVIMHGVSPSEARGLAEHVSATFAMLDIRNEQGETFRCTVSAGIAFGEAGGAEMEEILARADQALYAAKRDGRNRVVIGKLRVAS